MLLSVDEAVAAIVAELAQEGILDDTYIVFASDNGFFRGEHRIAGGKYLAYEPSARVPMMIRGPGIPPGGVSDELVSALDITQTIARDRRRARPTRRSTGAPFSPTPQNPALRSTRPILLEADTGPGKGSPGIDAQTAAAATLAQGTAAGPPRRENLDQEKMATKSAANGNIAPAYRAIRTDRYLYVALRQRADRALRHEARPRPAPQPRRPTRATARSASGCTATWSASRPAPARPAGSRSAPIPRR